MSNQLKIPVNSINQTDLVNKLMSQFNELPKNTIKHAVKNILKLITKNLTKGNKIELRGFGVFKTRFRAGITARNPKNGEKFELNARYMVHFKPGKALLKQINNHEEK